MSASNTDPATQPLANLDQWEDFVQGRYREGKSQSEFRQYDGKANSGVAEFYRLNHRYQTVEYVLGKERQYFGLQRGEKSILFMSKIESTSPPIYTNINGTRKSSSEAPATAAAIC